MLLEQGHGGQGRCHLCQGIAGAVEFDMAKSPIAVDFANHLGGKHGRVGFAFPLHAAGGKKPAAQPAGRRRVEVSTLPGGNSRVRWRWESQA